MFYYGYIDESGTKSDQVFMTVALVVMEGRRAAERLHARALREFYPYRFQKIKSRPHRNLFEIHFADMNDIEKGRLAQLFGKSKVSAFVSYYRHYDAREHDERFFIYKQLVQLAMESAFHFYSELSVTIAKQGGWQRYQQSFLSELRPLSETFIERGKFCKARYELASNSNLGIQIADYYAGCFRDYLKSGQDTNSSVGYGFIAHQIKKVTAYTAN